MTFHIKFHLMPMTSFLDSLDPADDIVGSVNEERCN